MTTCSAASRSSTTSPTWLSGAPLRYPPEADEGPAVVRARLEDVDLAAAERVVLDHGLETFNHGDYPPGRRFYFFDWDGIEFEVVSYE